MTALAYSNYSDTELLTFRHLYDDKWGLTRKPRRKWQDPIIIMPSGFVPETGRQYECIVSETATGTFIFEGIRYHLCYAHLINKGSVIDEFEYKRKVRGQEAKTKNRDNPLADKLGTLKEGLPPKHEIVECLVVPDRKNGGKMFEPQYLDEDRLVNGLPSMRFYTHKKVNKFSLGQTVKARVKQKNFHNTGKTNKKGALIIMVPVELI